MNVKLQFVTREVAGDVLLVPVGKTSLDLNGMLTLNELGAELWKRIPEAKDEEALADSIIEDYDVTPEQARADVHEFLEKLRDLGIL